jgi:uncharacterized protein YecE (DUF72 family)
MEFGKVHDVSLLDEINWKLPKEDELVQPFLSQFKQENTRIWIGAPAWSHKEWVGKIYPPKTKATDYLVHYAKYFNTIELNTTHYRIPTPEQTQKWVDKVTDDFLFCPKIFQGISHEYSGLKDLGLHKEWFQFLKSLGSHCGPSFLQLPPYFDYEQKSKLFHFLQLWPAEFKLAIEFRHESWFQNGTVLPALTQYLQSRKIGLVITDVAGRRDVLHSTITAPHALVRFIGNELHPTDFIRAENWNERFIVWEKQGLNDLFLFVHEPDDINVPEMADQFRKLSFFNKS